MEAYQCCDSVPFLPLANVCVVKVDGTPYLCKADEVGEICVNSSATGMAYFGLLGITKNVFEVCISPCYNVRFHCYISSISPWK